MIQSILLLCLISFLSGCADLYEPKISYKDTGRPLSQTAIVAQDGYSLYSMDIQKVDGVNQCTPICKPFLRLAPGIHSFMLDLKGDYEGSGTLKAMIESKHTYVIRYQFVDYQEGIFGIKTSNRVRFSILDLGKNATITINSYAFYEKPRKFKFQFN